MSQESKDVMSQELWKMTKETWKDKEIYQGSLSGYDCPRYLNLLETGTRMGLTSEGVGSKIHLASEVNEFGSIGHDLLAMVLDDVARLGATALGMTTTIDIGKHNQSKQYEERTIKDIMYSITHCAEYCTGVPILDGELSYLDSYIGGRGIIPIILNGSAFWKVEPSRFVNGAYVKPGDTIIALPETGFRSNGFTFLQSVLDKVFPDNTWKGASIYTSEGTCLVSGLVLEPSSIYYPYIDKLMATSLASSISGMVHITGGGVPGKLSKYLKRSNTSAIIEKSMPSMSPLIKYFLENGHVSLRSAVENWNMGYGFLIITPNPKSVLDFFGHYPAQIVGRVIEESHPRVKMKVSTSLDFY